MLTKEKVIHTISSLPESFSIDDLVERMIILEKLEKGLKDSDDGSVVSEPKLNGPNDKNAYT